MLENCLGFKPNIIYVSHGESSFINEYIQESKVNFKSANIFGAARKCPKRPFYPKLPSMPNPCKEHKAQCPEPVSYTHLDVYKRQQLDRRDNIQLGTH